MTQKNGWASVDSKQWVYSLTQKKGWAMGIIVKLRASKIKKKAFIRTKVKSFIGVNVIKIG